MPMNQRRIVYIHQKNIPPVIVNRIKELYTPYDHKSLTKILDITSHQQFYSRIGKNTLPFKYDEGFFKSPMPVVNQNSEDSFEYITDQRCYNLLKTHNDRPWLVQWSGGIDSTLIVCSLLKNMSKQQLENVVISCNHISIFENPKFYHTWVAPNFKIIDSTNSSIESYLDTHYVIDGNPADMLQGSGLGLFARSCGINTTANWRDSADQIIKFLSVLVGKQAAHWAYSTLDENISSIDSNIIPIESCADWFWWINFNWKWPADRFHEMDWLHLDNLSPYFKSMINWYDSDEYQLWSINHGRYGLFDDTTNPGQYKLPSKQYIYQIDKNEHYLKFKTPTKSDSRVKIRSWLCVLDDLTTLNAERDLDLILDLLPTHLNI